MRSIPFFNYPVLFEEYRKDYLSIVEDVLSRGAYIMQKDLADFESELADYCGVKHAIGTADGTMAILTALLALDLEPGFEVILPSHTFVATASAVHFAGGKPVLADVGSDHLIDPASVESLITEKTRVLLPVQLNGRVANMSPICELAKKYNLHIVEDSCQALGAKFKGQQAGTFGAAGAFSFYPSKTLGAFGDAGALITNSDEIADKVKLIRDHGRNPETGLVERFGFNARLDNLHAAILLFKLRKYPDFIARRRHLAGIYNEMLSEVPQLILPPAPDSNGDHYDIFQNYEIEVEQRDALRIYLSEQGVGTILQWGGKTIHQFSDLGCNDALPHCEKMTKSFMLLPMNTTLTDEDVVYISNKIRDFYG